MGRMGEEACCQRVIFAYEDESQGEITMPFWVPVNLLWSGEGVKYAFEACRDSWLGPTTDENREDWARESWHIVAIEPESKDVDHLVLGMVSDPEHLALDLHV